MFGSSGRDIFEISSDNGFIIDGDPGTFIEDTINFGSSESGVSFDLNDYNQLGKFLEIVGSDGGDDNIIGSNILSNATSLHGLGGDDRLTSLNAEDKLYGGDGNDTYNVSSDKIALFETSYGDYDKIVSSTNNYSMEFERQH